MGDDCRNDPAETEQGDKNRQRIIKATLDLILASGVEQLSTAAVYQSAGVSRTTVYRYFATRQALLEAVISHLSDEYERKLRIMIAERPGVQHRLDVIIDLVIEQQSQQTGQRLLQVAPAFVIKIIEFTLRGNVGIFNDAMRDVYDSAEAIVGSPVHGDLIGNIMTRLFATLFLLPTPALPGNFRNVIRAVIRALLLNLHGLTDAEPVRVPDRS